MLAARARHLVVPRGLVALSIAALALSISGCGEGIARGSGPPEVVAAEGTWGSIAAQLAGPTGHVHSVVTDPAVDPHSYEPTAADARALASAQLVIVNGLGYDPWAGHLLSANPQPGRVTLDVGSVLGLGDGANPHRWYAPGDVDAVAHAIERDLVALDPPHRAAYAAALHRFTTVSLAPYHRLIADIRARFAGEPLGASESIFAPLAASLHVRLITPPGLLKAISEGAEPSARDASAAAAQIAARQIRVWVVNGQNDTPQVSTLTAQARAAGIPVVTITETPGPAGTTFQAWQVAQLTRLAAALHQAVGR